MDAAQAVKTLLSTERGKEADEARREAWSALDADDARRVLLDRETAHPGWGADQAAIDKMIASARKRAQRNVQAWG